jgi:anti-anti-sigma factor
MERVLTSISLCVVNRVAHVRIAGSLGDGLNAGPSLERMIRRCAGLRLMLIVVNLRLVREFDASGLAALLAAHRMAQSVGACFCLRDVPSRVVERLTAARLDTILRVRRSADQRFGGHIECAADQAEHSNMEASREARLLPILGFSRSLAPENGPIAACQQNADVRAAANWRDIVDGFVD